ncbi:hypothetical protein ACLB2K_015712 [Fragaria x ananassa]
MTLSIDENHSPHWEYKKLVDVTNEDRHQYSKSSTYRRDVDELKNNWKDMKKKLGLTEDVSVSTCGTITPLIEEELSKFIFKESVSHNDDKPKNRRFRYGSNQDPQEMMIYGSYSWDTAIYD